MNNQEIPPQETHISTGSIRSLVDVSRVHINVSQELIIITEDKMRLCLSEHLGRIEKRKSWIAPLGVLVAIIVTLVTSTFKDIGLDAAIWEAIFIISGIISFFWLICSAIQAFHSEKIEDIVGEMKKLSSAKK